MIDRRISSVPMESAMMYPYNSITRTFISKPYVNILSSNYNKTGMLQSYPPLLPTPPVNKRLNHRNSKSKSPKKNMRREGKNSPKKCSEFSVVLSNDSFISKKLTSYKTEEKNHVETFSGSVAFSMISPAPSSLPLPTFSLRPKLIDCKAQVAEINAGATDDLRRLLRIQ